MVLESFGVRLAVAAVSDVLAATSSLAVSSQAFDSVREAQILREQAYVLKGHTEFFPDMEERSPPLTEVMGFLNATKPPPEGDLKSLANEFRPGFIRRLKAGELHRLAGDHLDPDPSVPSPPLPLPQATLPRSSGMKWR
jgi:hypothetical protein